MPPCLSLENDTSSGASYLFFPFFRVPLCDHNDGGSIDDVAWHVVRGRLIFDKYTMKCTIGSVVECVIAIHATRVRFSDIACFFFLRTSFYGSCYFLNHFVGNRRAWTTVFVLILAIFVKNERARVSDLSVLTMTQLRPESTKSSERGYIQAGWSTKPQIPSHANVHAVLES